MKLKPTILALAVVALVGVNSPDAKAELCSGRGEVSGQDMASLFSLWPLWTTTALLCANGFDKEIHAHLVMREATSVIEDEQIYQPSFLGAYAESKGVKTKKGMVKLAHKVLRDGVN